MVSLQVLGKTFGQHKDVSMFSLAPERVPLFDPRTSQWEFSADELLIVGLAYTHEEYHKTFNVPESPSCTKESCAVECARACGLPGEVEGCKCLYQFVGKVRLL